MHVERLYAAQFRNLRGLTGAEPLDWQPHPHFNLLTGDNGEGKTNTLEALAILATLRSFRTPKLTDCLAFAGPGQPAVTSASLATSVQVQGLRRDLGLSLQHKGKKLLLDGKAVTAGGFVGHLTAVLFVPSDLTLAHDEPDVRRKWLDRLCFNHYPQHLTDLRQVESVLANRNALLKQGRERLANGQPFDADLIAVYDDLLARHGAQVTLRRLQVLQRFAPKAAEVFGRVAAPGLQLDLRYAAKTALGPLGTAVPDLADVDLLAGHWLQTLAAALLDDLTVQRRRDLALGYTSRGPHRDDVLMLLSGRPAAQHASQGQSRAMVLACKIAEIRSLEEMLGEPPLLLMDDVSSELDAERNRALMAYLSDLGGQVVLTTTDPGYIRVSAPRQVVRVRAGQLEPGAVLQ
jgi:DNA replication and repair protein RecF